MKEDLSLYLSLSLFLSVRAEREGNESEEARDSGRPFRGDPFFWLGIVEFVILHWIALNLS